MITVRTESMALHKEQFNSGRRSISITREDGSDPIYAKVVLQAENSGFGSQLPSEIVVHVRPGTPIDIAFDRKMPMPYPATYSSDEAGKHAAMSAGLDYMCKQAEEWVQTFVYTRSPNER